MLFRSPVLREHDAGIDADALELSRAQSVAMLESAPVVLLVMMTRLFPSAAATQPVVSALMTTAISAADASDTAKIFSATKFNGDGIIAPAVTRRLIADVAGKGMPAALLAALGQRWEKEIEELRRRDERDAANTHRAPDAVEIDTTSLSSFVVTRLAPEKNRRLESVNSIV